MRAESRILYPKYDADVIQAVHDGKRLCGYCLGRKRIQRTYTSDFGPLEVRNILVACEACKGTGLENGRG